MRVIKLRLNGKIVGWIEGNEYHTDRRPEHFMRKFRSFGISMSVIEYLKNRGVNVIVIHYHGKKGDKTYYASLEQYENGITWFDGDDEQKHVSIDDMYKSKLAYSTHF